MGGGSGRGGGGGGGKLTRHGGREERTVSRNISKLRGRKKTEGRDAYRSEEKESRESEINVRMKREGKEGKIVRR